MMTSAIGEASLESWERHTAAGFRALSCGLWREAADEWLKSIDDVRSAESWDARRAAALNNSGVTCLLESRWAAAEDYFAKARQAWMQTEARIPELDVPVVGRSSVFHFRLATRHHNAFDANRRRRCAVLCKAASAITDFNAGLVARRAVARSASPCENMSPIVRALVDAFGPRCPELQLIRVDDNSVAEPAEIPSARGEETDALYGEKARRVFELKARSMAAALSADYRRLEMATNLTALLSPRLLPACTGSPSHLDGSEK
jgi:hypothetical protein